jgi:hypothetical protein
MGGAVDGNRLACLRDFIAHSCASRLAAKRFRGNLAPGQLGCMCGSSHFLASALEGGESLASDRGACCE